MIISILFVFLISILIASSSTEPQELWNKTFGGSSADVGYEVIETSDGGLALLGNTASFGAGGYDLWIIKTNSNGDGLWNKTFGGSNHDRYDTMGVGSHRIIETSDGGLAFTASTHSFGAGGYDLWIIKTDSSGNELWNKTFGTYDDDYGFCIVETSDGGLLVAGSFFDGVFEGSPRDKGILIKVDNNGSYIWNNTWGVNDTFEDAGVSIIKTFDNNYVVAGISSSGDTYTASVFLMKVDSNGDGLWNKTWGIEQLTGTSSIVETSDNNYALTGLSFDYGRGNWNSFILKVDKDNGDEIWYKTFDTGHQEMGYSIIETSDNELASFGSLDFGEYVYDSWLIKTDSSGNELWNKTFGGINDDNGSSVIETSDGGLALLGDTSSFGEGNSDFWLIKLSQGALQVTDIIPVQVVPGVDLVKDKTGIVRVVVESSENNVNANVRLYFDNELIGNKTEVFNIGSKNVDFDFKPDKAGTNLALRAEAEET